MLSKLFSDTNLELGGAVIDGQQAASALSEYNNEGYFIRAQYDYADRIFASGSFRRDASSRFHQDHRWGNFWSAGAGWLMDREPWFDIWWVDLLKLKAALRDRVDALYPASTQLPGADVRVAEVESGFLI